MFLIFRLGDSGDSFHWGFGPLVGTERAENDMILGILASTGYFFIVIVLMLGIVMGDTGKYSVHRIVTKCRLYTSPLSPAVPVQPVWVPAVYLCWFISDMGLQEQE